MIRRKSTLACLLGSALAISFAGSQAFASSEDKYKHRPKHKKNTITLMQLSDVHGHIHPHAEIFPDGRMDPHSGGLAKLTTLIKDVREDAPNSLLLAVGDTTHGSAEMLFSLGDLIMPWMNSLDIDAFTPGNWDFGFGPRVYRQRFTQASPPLSPNNRTTIAWMDGRSGHEDQECNTPPSPGNPFVPYDKCHVTRATFPTVAMNVYNYNDAAAMSNPAQPLGPLVHKPYLIKDVGKTRIAILGLTTDVVPQQAQAFNTNFRFTMGYKEMPQQIAAAKAEGADLIVVLSELGLAKNVQMVREYPEIDVMFSGHTHERTPEAIVIKHKKGRSFSIVTEAGEDSFLGRLDLKVNGKGRIVDFDWEMIEADSSVDEDPEVAEMVEEARSTFVAGDEHECHTFGVAAFPFGSGHTLCDPLDKAVGSTEVTIQRWNVLEDIANNVMVDAFLDLAEALGTSDSKGYPLTDANTLSTTNGFRFDVVILGSLDGFSGDITVGDLYDYYPIGAATGLAEYTGGRLKAQWEGILTNVFDPNPFRQRGGWNLGFTRNMHFDIRLSDDFPRSISYGAQRIARVTIDDGSGPQRIDESKIYTLASCYPHGNPVDEVCRTTGATNLRFITANQESGGPTDVFGNRQLDMDGSFLVEDPVNSEDIWNPVRFANGGPLFLKVAPNGFVHPVDALRRYLAFHTVNETDDGPGRVTAIDPVPVSEFGGAGIVQPTQGAGAEWLKREFVQPRKGH